MQTRNTSPYIISPKYCPTNSRTLKIDLASIWYSNYLNTEYSIIGDIQDRTGMRRLEALFINQLYYIP
jgi:hypothetical protein